MCLLFENFGLLFISTFGHTVCNYNIGSRMWRHQLASIRDFHLPNPFLVESSLAGCRSLLEAFVSFSTVSLLAAVPRTIPARPGVAFNLDPVIALQSQRATSQSQRRRRRAVFLISFAVLRSSYSSSFCTLNFIDIC